MKRQWPDFYKLYLNDDFISFIKQWMEQNIPKEVLDKIAPPICENHEPVVDLRIYNYVDKYWLIQCKNCGAEIKPSGWELK